MTQLRSELNEKQNWLFTNRAKAALLQRFKLGGGKANAKKLRAHLSKGHATSHSKGTKDRIWRGKTF